MENNDHPEDDKEVERSLARSILMVFLRTAGADGDVTRAELSTLIELVRKQDEHDGPLFNRAKQVLLENKNAFIRELDHIRIDFVGNITAIKNLLEKKFPDEADSFKMSLYRMSKSVAESSVDFFGLGPKINKAERSALRTIATLLGIPPH